MRTMLTMRAAMAMVALSSGGCSLLFDGKDLKGKAGGGNDMALGGDDDMADNGSTDMAGGGGGGGGSSACTPVTHAIAFTVGTAAVAATNPYAIALGDIDRDGKVDIITGNDASNSFSVLLGKGDGTFTIAAATPVSTCTTPSTVVVDDFTNDGKPDILVGCYDNSGAMPVAALKLYRSTSTPGTVSFASALTLTPPSATHSFSIKSGKFNSDGNRDLVYVDYVGNNVVFLFGNGAGAFSAIAPITTGLSPEYPAIGDVNKDGIDDVLTANYNDNTLTLLVSAAASPPFVAQRLAYDAAPAVMNGTAYFIYDPRLVDFDGDGDLDIVMASGTTTPGNVEALVNGGTATAPSFPVTPTDYAVGDKPIALETADFNCDGHPDVVTSSMNQTKIWVLPRLGNGFDAPQPTTLADGYNVVVADFNGDGYPDVATGGAGASVHVLINNH